MEELVDDEALDVEALQAQIELSLAHTQNLVSSWLQPAGSGASFPKAARRDEEKEIQELLKRPPRLGVGAPIPASTGVLGREAVKLKGKLVGKKRGREAEEPAIAEESEGEEESRAGAIRKKARVDPFSKGKGKGKKKKQVAEREEEPAIHPLLNPAVHDPPSNAKDRTPDPEGPEDDASNERLAIGTPTSSPRKKKKKKKRALHEVAPVAAATDLSVTASPDPARAGNELPAPTNSSPRSPTQPLISGIPLLNFDGPPPILVTSPAKKKRKRNKKKKKKQALESDEHTAVAHEDDEEEV